MRHGFTATTMCWLWLFSGLPSVAAQPIQPIQPGAPITYEPFFPDRWKQRGQSMRMVPWEGKQIVMLTTRADFDRRTMAVFLRRLDAGWMLYRDLVGRAPTPNRQHNDKPIIAAVPDSSFTCGIGCGQMGMTGIEVGGFYDGDYARVSGQAEEFPHYFFYEMGRNYFVFGDRHSDFATGFAVFMRYVCMDTLQCRDPDARTRQAIDKAESRVGDSKLSFLQAFTSVGGEAGDRLSDLTPSDRAVMYASAMLKMRREYGGNDWVRRFFAALSKCPEVGGDTDHRAAAQSVLWFVAASCAARRDLSDLFADRWKMPLGRKSRVALRGINWKAAELSPAKVLAALPADELPDGIAMLAPGYLTPARRRANLLIDGSFEHGKPKAWSAVSWRGNTDAARVEAGEAKAGANQLAIVSPESNDARYTQKVAVKPHTRYLLGGWVKTKQVTITQDGGRFGANLSLDGGYEASGTLVGDNDWTYVALQFDSGRRTEVTVCARLGFYNSTVTGSAWFDDLVLIELESAAPGSDRRPPKSSSAK
jgi:hypothetical protein